MPAPRRILLLGELHQHARGLLGSCISGGPGAIRNAFRHVTEWTTLNSLPKRPRTRKCALCREPFYVKPRGRVAAFCSTSCKQRAYEQRKWKRPHAVEALAQDVATMKVRAYVRAEIWAVLQELGLAPKQALPPPLPTKKRKPALRIVTNANSE
jgi:hypothetical protein